VAAAGRPSGPGRQPSPRAARRPDERDRVGRIASWVGLDVGKQDHHATVVSAAGEPLFELAVRNDEAAIERLLDRALEAGPCAKGAATSRPLVSTAGGASSCSQAGADGADDLGVVDPLQVEDSRSQPRHGVLRLRCPWSAAGSAAAALARPPVECHFRLCERGRLPQRADRALDQLGLALHERGSLL
jgi:Transposase